MASSIWSQGSLCQQLTIGKHAVSKSGRWLGGSIPAGVGRFRQHAAVRDEVAVQFESFCQVVADMATGTALQIFQKIRSIVGVGAVCDDGVRPLHGTEAAQIRQPLLGDDHLNRMFVVIQVGYHGYDAGDIAVFQAGRAGEK